MVAIRTTIDGLAMYITDMDIVGITGPRPSDVEIKSYIIAIGYQPIGSVEPVQALIQRLSITPQTFALLTRPNGSHVWIRGSSVTEVRPPLWTELQDPPNIARSIVGYATMHQSVQETLEQVKSLVVAAGASSGLFSDTSSNSV